jgi:hypothetical protein
MAAGFTPAATHGTFSSPKHRPEYLLRKVDLAGRGERRESGAQGPEAGDHRDSPLSAAT